MRVVPQSCRRRFVAQHLGNVNDIFAALVQYARERVAAIVHRVARDLALRRGNREAFHQVAGIHRRPFPEYEVGGLAVAAKLAQPENVL
jgi:hypothetical protein